MKLFKRFLRILALVILLGLLYLGGVIGYAWFYDFDPPPTEVPDLLGKAQKPVLDKDTLVLFNWNIGFCGLGEAADFFYDSDKSSFYSDGGTNVHTPKDQVEKNLAGVLSTLHSAVRETDFFLLQEVDIRSDRSQEVNEVQAISEKLQGFVEAFGKNYDVDFIPLPLTNPMGEVLSGLSTWSRYQPAEVKRYAFEGNYNFPNYLFFLDRCFLLERFPLANGTELVLINTHNSAYDDGTLRQKQMQQLRQVLLEEYSNGNYVIVGGDWNQFPPGYQGVYAYTQGKGPRMIPPNKTDSKFFVPKDYPAQGWQWAYDPNIATNRALDAPFDPDATYQCIIDFYLLSPNIEILEVKTIDQQFQFSDHQPVTLKARLVGLAEPDSSRSDGVSSKF